MKFKTDSILASTCVMVEENKNYCALNNINRASNQVIPEEDFVKAFNNLQDRLPMPITFNYDSTRVIGIAQKATLYREHGRLHIGVSGEMLSEVTPTYISVSLFVENRVYDREADSSELRDVSIVELTGFNIRGYDDTTKVEYQELE